MLGFEELLIDRGTGILVLFRVDAVTLRLVRIYLAYNAESRIAQ